MSDKKTYRVKVTEIHSDYVWIKASSPEEAERLAPGVAHCEFEGVHVCRVVAGTSDEFFHSHFPTHKDNVK